MVHRPIHKSTALLVAPLSSPQLLVAPLSSLQTPCGSALKPTDSLLALLILELRPTNYGPSSQAMTVGKRQSMKVITALQKTLDASSKAILQDDFTKQSHPARAFLF
ncbi:hypothetical protein L596_010435 [Steinernema carpocapsae]|uniref:Uncharacterized protein n=1 Tax=Steinernema carpocapsae TaxID=34508 RepID=A0A4U5PIJ9_STECR|nr:hypothetical protein L596_010435 [Steinernema carpocapsae]